MSKETKRVALITGASSGIGKDFALRLLAQGYVVYGAARRVERSMRLKDIPILCEWRSNRLVSM